MQDHASREAREAFKSPIVLGRAENVEVCVCGGGASSL